MAQKPDITHAAVYLSVGEAAARVGMAADAFRNLRTLPPADAVIGSAAGRTQYGWLPATIDTWAAHRNQTT